ncbi:MAG: N-acetyltransferase family protein [Actinomycetota bacterium]
MDVLLATPDDVEAIRRFGAEHIPSHYGPLLGPDAARAQVDNWWTIERMAKAVSEGRVVVAKDDGNVVGVGEWSIYQGIPVIWKLYVHPSLRGRGTGPRLIDAIIAGLPDGVDRLQVEHFAGNRRAGAFYEREGFREIRKGQHPSNSVFDVVWRERSLR